MNSGQDFFRCIRLQAHHSRRAGFIVRVIGRHVTGGVWGGSCRLLHGFASIKLMHSILFRNSFVLLLARIGTQIGTAVFTVVLARRLGITGFGEYALIAALIYVANSLTTFGTDMALIREIAAQDDLSSLPAALIIQLALSVLLIAAI